MKHLFHFKLKKNNFILSVKLNPLWSVYKIGNSSIFHGSLLSSYTYNVYSYPITYKMWILKNSGSEPFLNIIRSGSNKYIFSSSFIPDIYVWMLRHLTSGWKREPGKNAKNFAGGNVEVRENNLWRSKTALQFLKTQCLGKFCILTLGSKILTLSH